MGSVGTKQSSYTRREEDIKKTSIIFGKAAIVDSSEGSYTDIDGYMYARNEKELLTKLAKTVDLYDENEGNALRMMVKFDEVGQLPPTKGSDGRWDGGYILEWEPVSGASQWNEEKNEMEYSNKRANYYVHVRFIR